MIKCISFSTVAVCYAFAVLLLAGCNNAAENPAPGAEPGRVEASRQSPSVSQDNADTLSANPSVARIRAVCQRINAAALDSTAFTFVCDAETQVVVYQQAGQTVKVKVDEGWVGDAASVTEYYYEAGKLVFVYNRTVGAVGNEPLRVSEVRSYVKDDRVFRTLHGTKEAPCNPCRFDASAKEYRMAAATSNATAKEAFCR